MTTSFKPSLGKDCLTPFAGYFIVFLIVLLKGAVLNHRESLISEFKHLQCQASHKTKYSKERR